MPKLIDKTGAETGATISQQQIQESIANYRSSSRNETSAFSYAVVCDAVAKAIEKSPDYKDVCVYLGKESAGSPKYFLMVIGTDGADMKGVSTLSDDSLVHLTECPSSACPP